MKKPATGKTTSKDAADKPRKTAAPKKSSGKAATKPTVKKTATAKVSSKKATTTKKTAAAKPKKVSSKKAEAKKVISFS